MHTLLGSLGGVVFVHHRSQAASLAFAVLAVPCVQRNAALERTRRARRTPLRSRSPRLHASRARFLTLMRAGTTCEAERPTTRHARGRPVGGRAGHGIVSVKLAGGVAAQPLQGRGHQRRRGERGGHVWGLHRGASVRTPRAPRPRARGKQRTCVPACHVRTGASCRFRADAVLASRHVACRSVVRSCGVAWPCRSATTRWRTSRGKGALGRRSCAGCARRARRLRNATRRPLCCHLPPRPPETRRPAPRRRKRTVAARRRAASTGCSAPTCPRRRAPPRAAPRRTCA